MHISEGILSWQVLAGSGVVTIAGTALGLKKLDYDQIAQAGVLSAAFFVASLIHIPLGPSNVHLILNGLVGLILGWAAFPAILIALILQAVLFQFGGLTTLGVNTIIMAVPAVACYYCLRPFISGSNSRLWLAALLGGALAVLGSSLLAAAALIFSEENFWEMAVLIVATHIPVMVVEGLVAAFAVTFLKKVKPSLLMAS